MFCFKCGKEIPAQSVFCLHCGAKLPSVPAKQEPAAQSCLTPIWEDADFDLPIVPSVPEPLSPEKPQTPQPAPSPPQKRCAVCGRELLESSISDLCVTCLNNRSFVAVPPDLEKEDFFLTDPLSDGSDTDLEAMPLSSKRESFQLDVDLDVEYPGAYAEESQSRPPEKKSLRWLAILAIVLAVVGCFAIFMPMLLPLFSGGASSSQSAQTTNLERKVVSYARKMTQIACANPDSVKFEKDEKVSEQEDVWTVQETFSRTSRQGEQVTTIYIAVLRLDSKQADGYAPIKLQIDDTVMYDYSQS